MLEPQDAKDSLGSRSRAIAQAVVRAGNHYERTVQKLSRHPRARLAGRANRELAQEHGGHRFRRTNAILIGNAGHSNPVFVRHETAAVAQGMLGFRLG